MPDFLDDDQSRIADLVNIFVAKGHGRAQRAGDPEEFVLLAYIAKSLIDRALGPGNAHSAALSGLCDVPEAGQALENLASGNTLPERYRRAADILLTASRDPRA